LPRTEAENERVLAVVDRLMTKGEDNLTPEETALLEIFVRLIAPRPLQPRRQIGAP